MKSLTKWIGRLAAAAVLAVGLGGTATAGTPTQLKVAAVLSAGLENAWDRSWYESFQRVKAEAPDGLELSVDYTEGVWGDEAEQVLRAYAETGKYGIIWANSSYSDQVANLKDEFPDILWVVVGAGNTGLGGNVYYVYMHAHEPAYLLGLIAGMMTETNVIGAVGLFPSDDVNDQINAYFRGAREVDPAVRTKISFIESWYDPPKALEAANAQIAAGADFIFQLGESYEACQQNHVKCFANYIDQNYIAPDVIVATSEALWDPAIRWVIDEWYAHVTSGAAYNGNIEPRWFSMAEGGSGLSPYHNWEGKIPDEVKAKVAETMARMKAGTLKIPLEVEVPVSN